MNVVLEALSHLGAAEEFSGTEAAAGLASLGWEATALPEEGEDFPRRWERDGIAGWIQDADNAVRIEFTLWEFAYGLGRRAGGPSCGWS
jgi:hypothetical protein